MENGSVISNLATKHTQLTAYLEIGRGRRRREDNEG